MSDERGGRGGRGSKGADKAAQSQRRSFFRRRRVCKFCADKIDIISYKDVKLLSGFIPERRKIQPRRLSGTCGTTRVANASISASTLRRRKIDPTKSTIGARVFSLLLAACRRMPGGTTRILARDTPR